MLPMVIKHELHFLKIPNESVVFIKFNCFFVWLQKEITALRSENARLSSERKESLQVCFNFGD